MEVGDNIVAEGGNEGGRLIKPAKRPYFNAYFSVCKCVYVLMLNLEINS